MHSISPAGGKWKPLGIQAGIFIEFLTANYVRRYSKPGWDLEHYSELAG